MQKYYDLKKLGIIEPLKFSDWAVPIVPVHKADKHSVQLCGNFKMTVNTAAKVDRYSIPRIEDLFVKLNEEKKFSKVNLSQAYNQLVLDDNSKKLMVINICIEAYFNLIICPLAYHQLHQVFFSALSSRCYVVFQMWLSILTIHL